MKKLIRFLLILVVGMILGYLFHNTIDAKLKATFGKERVEKTNAIVKKGIKNTAEVGKKVGKKAIDAGKAAIDSVKEKK